MNKVKWGVIGTANIAETQTIPGLIGAYNAELCAIAGRSLERAEMFKDKFGFEKAYGSYEELIQDPDVQAVYIPLPNHLHLEWIKKAAAAGKHILCEKPMCGNAAELEEAFAAAKAHGVILMEAYAYLHSEAFCSLIKSVQEKEIGESRLIESCFFIAPPGPSNVRWVREYYGGSIYDVGCYPISMILRMKNETPVEIKATAHFAESKVDDFAQIYLRFADGTIADVSCGFCSYLRSDRHYIHGDKGTIKAEIPFNEPGHLEYEVLTAEPKKYEFDVPRNYQLEAEQMGRCILEGEQPHISEDFSRLVITVLEEVLRQVGY